MPTLMGDVASPHVVGTCSANRWSNLTGTFTLLCPKVWQEVTPSGLEGTGLLSRALSSVYVILVAAQPGESLHYAEAAILNRLKSSVW